MHLVTSVSRLVNGYFFCYLIHTSLSLQALIQVFLLMKELTGNSRANWAAGSCTDFEASNRNSWMEQFFSYDGVSYAVVHLVKSVSRFENGYFSCYLVVECRLAHLTVPSSSDSSIPIG